MSNKDFRGLEEIVVNGKVYVNKAELLQLIKEEKDKFFEGKEIGYLCDKKKQRIAAMGSLNHLAVLINKRFYDNLNKDVSRYLIGSLNEESGTMCYFRGYCGCVPDSKPVPAFTEDQSEAQRFETRELANDVIAHIRDDYPGLDIAPVRAVWARSRSGLEIIHRIFGYPEGREPEEVLKAEMKLALEDMQNYHE